MSHVVLYRLLPTTLAISLGFALITSAPIQAADQTIGVIATAPEDRCQTLHAQKQRLNEDIAAQDAELTVRLGQMKSAPTEQKAVLVAAIVTTLVEQRVIRDVRRAKLADEMMAHMMNHLGKRGMEKMGQEMCPMMKSLDDRVMKTMDDKNNNQPLDGSTGRAQAKP